MSTVTKTKMDAYTVRADHEYALIALREWSRPVNDGANTYYCGDILIHSSFGSWAHTWTACGVPFREFLTDIEFGYAFGKFMGASLYVYDGESTVRELRKQILVKRQCDELTKGQARALWYEVDSNEAEMLTSDRDFCEAVWRIKEELSDNDANKITRGHALRGIFDEPYEWTQTSADRSAKNFWDKLWTVFRSELQRELALQGEPT